jgi:hypothetical protein
MLAALIAIVVAGVVFGMRLAARALRLTDGR